MYIVNANLRREKKSLEPEIGRLQGANRFSERETERYKLRHHG